MQRPAPGPWVTAAVVVAAAALVASSVLGRPADGSLFALDVVVGVLGVAAMPFLLRGPVPAALVLAALAAVSPAATPTATIGTLQVARERELPVALGVGAAGFLAHLVQGFLRPIEGLPFSWFLVLDLVVHAALVAWGALLRARAALLDSLRERARRAEQEQAERVAAARVQERTVIAREMHDVLAHRLSLVAASAGALEYRPDAPPEQLARAAGVVRTGVHQALEELREVIGVLRADTSESGAAESPERPPQPVLTDVAALVEESRCDGTRVRFEDTVVAVGSVPATVGRAAYRIVQESLTNARKHAAGQPVEVTLSGGPGEGVRVRVTNPVADRTATLPGAGAGLVGLAERAALVGGTLEHGVTDGRFRVTARLPWPR